MLDWNSDEQNYELEAEFLAELRARDQAMGLELENYHYDLLCDSTNLNHVFISPDSPVLHAADNDNKENSLSGVAPPLLPSPAEATGLNPRPSMGGASDLYVEELQEQTSTKLVTVCDEDATPGRSCDESGLDRLSVHTDAATPSQVDSTVTSSGSAASSPLGVSSEKGKEKEVVEPVLRNRRGVKIINYAECHDDDLLYNSLSPSPRMTRRNAGPSRSSGSASSAGPSCSRGQKRCREEAKDSGVVQGVEIPSRKKVHTLQGPRGATTATATVTEESTAGPSRESGRSRKGKEKEVYFSGTRTVGVNVKKYINAPAEKVKCGAAGCSYEYNVKNLSAAHKHFKDEHVFRCSDPSALGSSDDVYGADDSCDGSSDGDDVDESDDEGGDSGEDDDDDGDGGEPTDIGASREDKSVPVHLPPTIVCPWEGCRDTVSTHSMTLDRHLDHAHLLVRYQCNRGRCRKEYTRMYMLTKHMEVCDGKGGKAAKKTGGKKQGGKKRKRS